MSDLTGSWYLKQDEDSYKEVKVIEIIGDVAKAIGCDIPVSQLGTKYVRKEAIAPNPWAAVQLEGLLPEDTHSKTETVAETVSEQPQRQVTATVTQQTQSILVGNSPEENMLIAALKLSKQATVETITVDVQLSFDKNAIAELIKNFDIDKSVAKRILTEQVNKDVIASTSAKVVDSIVNTIFADAEVCDEEKADKK